MAFSMLADPALDMRSLLQLDWIDWNGSREHGVEVWIVFLLKMDVWELTRRDMSLLAMIFLDDKITPLNQSKFV
jgi:hypothetical protein